MVLTAGIPLVRIVAEYPVKLLLITVVVTFMFLVGWVGSASADVRKIQNPPRTASFFCIIFTGKRKALFFNGFQLARICCEDSAEW
jgi:hypothetical protein